jgi:hypothetical protein
MKQMPTSRVMNSKNRPGVGGDVLDVDHDSPAMTAEQFANARKVPRVKTIRTSLGLTQEEFAERYKIPIGTLRDWSSRGFDRMHLRARIFK